MAEEIRYVEALERDGVLVVLLREPVVESCGSGVVFLGEVGRNTEVGVRCVE